MFVKNNKRTLNMKRKLLKKISAIILLAMVLVSCGQDVKTNTAPETKDTINNKTIEEQPDVQSNPASVKTEVEIEKINAQQFASAQQQAKVNKPVEKITDFKMVQKELAGIVEFTALDDYLGVKKINFRNGTTSGDKDQLDECSFRAYFPAEDILLLECGHTTDRSFDLSTRKETYDTGNPDLVTSSPTGKYRLNKVFEGQECYYHFIQEKQSNKFQKLFELNTIFEKKFNKWLCVVEKEFWTDDFTLYFGLVTQFKEGINEYEYYKVKITNK